MSLTEIQAAYKHLTDQDRQEFRRWVLSYEAVVTEEDYTRYVCEAIDAGLSDADAGRTVSTDEARRHFGLPPR